MLRNSSASKDFPKLISLIKTHPDEVMLCTDDCHPDELQLGYINLMVKTALANGYDLFDVLTAASKTAIQLYKLPVGLLQPGDPADFVLIDSIHNFSILSTHLDGEEVYHFQQGYSFERRQISRINRFYQNSIVPDDLIVKRTGKYLSVIQVVEDSLLTKHRSITIDENITQIESDPDRDILKIVVLNRYQKAKPAVGFIQGFRLKKGAIAGSIAHDSHNIVAIGANDEDILRAIRAVQQHEGGLVVADQNETLILPLPVAGLMSDQSCETVAAQYQLLSDKAKALGSVLHAPFMTLAFMSLLVIPELKIGDRGLFDVNAFQFVELQHES
jgi:adenine deaminase